MKTFGIISFFLLSFVVNSSPTGQLDQMIPDLQNKSSLQRGIKYFMNYCFGCHSMEFQRYSRVAHDLGIPDDLMTENLVFNQAKINDLMANGMNKKEGRKWFGMLPPDLTLVARVRGADWLYTYLRSFYYDPKTTWGVNNQVFPNVGMPHVLESLQGRRLLVCNHNNDCFLQVDKQNPGELSTQQFDQMVYDLVNFMAYSAEPMKQERKKLGVYVILFLLLLLVIACLLKREYWKDVSAKL